jgi:hypothetical protein
MRLLVVYPPHRTRWGNRCVDGCTHRTLPFKDMNVNKQKRAGMMMLFCVLSYCALTSQ